MKFKPGDVVRLKSGGPKMTIEAVTDFETAVCVWFCQPDDLSYTPTNAQEHEFSLHAIEKAKGER